MWIKSRARGGRWADTFTALCGHCVRRLEVPEQVLGAIAEPVPLTDSPHDPRLITECPHCKRLIRFNPHTVDGKAREG